MTTKGKEGASDHVSFTCLSLATYLTETTCTVGVFFYFTAELSIDAAPWNREQGLFLDKNNNTDNRLNP